ncbi:MAG TPA: RNA 2',3'-cyclic phosphodiesterase [Terriglobia bacterium]|nr:RNA 2',3'-cyclic phosphodiesterase [Terriglobia bacterium]
MRVLIAVEVPNPIQAALSEVQHDLRSLSDTVQWVAPDSIHIALKFIGEIPEKRLEDIDSALTSLNWKPFTVTVRGVGFFPGTRSPRVLWAGLEAPTMKDLAEQVDARMERHGFDKEKRVFRPHITLARARQARMDSALVSGAAKFEEHDFGSFLVDRVYLFKDASSPAGGKYEKLKEFLL